MKNRTVYLLIAILFCSLSVSAQKEKKNEVIKVGELKRDNSVKATSVYRIKAGTESTVNVERKIELAEDSKPGEIIIAVGEDTKTLRLTIGSTITAGKLNIQIFDPNDKKKGTFSVGTQISSAKSETVSGNINKVFYEPLVGEWTVIIDPLKAKGVIEIKTRFVE